MKTKSKIAPTAIGDVYIKTIHEEIKNKSNKTELITKYSLCFKVYSNEGIEKVNTLSENDNIYILNRNFHKSTMFNYEKFYAKDKDLYSIDLPQTGIYTFTTITEKDNILKDSDNLTNEITTIPTNIEFKKTNNNASYYIKWDQHNDAERYQIKMYNERYQEIFSSILLKPIKDPEGILKATQSISLSDKSLGWIDIMQYGMHTVKYINICAIKFERNQIGSITNIQNSAEARIIIN